MIKKILHTSDWHIGRRLKNKERNEEFQKFFTWLEEIIKSEEIDALLVAGDIFDNTTPTVKAQDIYYSFLSRIAKSNCRHVIIISGNHDSPAFLDAPKDLLKLFKIHVVGGVCENPADEVLILNDEFNKPELIVCAVPYLRERDVRILRADDADNPENSLITGIKNHYEKVFAEAARLKLQNSNIPVIAMGHLFARGGKINNGDGVRSLYVGTAIEVGTDLFPDFLAYTALGHLHSPQKISRENIRYSGAPLVMDFGEFNQKKAVNILEFDGENLIDIKKIPVPVFQRLERVKGNLDEIFYGIENLASSNESIWLDIIYTGAESPGDLQEKIDEFIKNFSLIEVLSIRDESVRINEIFDQNEKFSQGLDDFSPLKIFEICLEEKNIPESQKKIFMPMYKEILEEVISEK